ncbi:TAXI family TRAP transporter solute-binding subunit [Iodidimonas sp. SYSU 1G8]|uniref:TAXI family TRAP transporter solute-binding subunit n=1 Tax=Iodidimonas sp. SYSU 1G8 TaxID=3133967 RepID=UPI0031FE9199
MTLFPYSGASFLSRRRLLQLSAGLAGASAFGVPMPALARRLRMAIVTGGTGGVFYPYGGGLAKVLTEKGDDIQATAQVTGGSVDNIMLLDAGEAEIGFSTVDSTFDAIRGLAPYDVVGPQKVNALAVLYESFLHVVVNANLPIQRIADLKGRRVSVGSAGSSTEAIADRALAAAGLDPRRDIVRDNLSVAESASALKDGKIAGFFWVGGVPTSAISDMASMGQPPLRILHAEEERRVMERKWPGIYEPFALPADIYVGQTEAVAGIGVANLLVVSSQVDGEFVTRVLKTIFDNLDTVHAIHPEARKLSIERAARETAVPFHPAAKAFYRARGAGA